MRAWWQRRLVRHGAFWAATLALSFLVQLPAHVLAGTPLYLGGLFFVQLPASLLAIYPLLYGVLPRLLRGQLGLGLGLLATWLPASIWLVNALRALYERGLSLLAGNPAPAFGWAGYQVLGYAWFVLLATAGAASTIKVLNGWQEQQRLGRQLRQRQLEAELQLLKAQLQPAFLFNTLATLHALTTRKAPESPAAVLHLAALLRYLLYESPQDLVPLADEAEMMQHYVALEQLRLGSRVDVSLSVSGALNAHRVAPLLLLPLVENAFRHGTAAGLDCPWVSIDLVAKKNSIIFKIINAHNGAESDGADFDSLHQRLARLYPDRHALKTVAEPDSFLAVLSLQLAPSSVSRRVAQQ